MSFTFRGEREPKLSSQLPPLLDGWGAIEIRWAIDDCQKFVKSTSTFSIPTSAATSDWKAATPSSHLGKFIALAGRRLSQVFLLSMLIWHRLLENETTNQC